MLRNVSLQQQLYTYLLDTFQKVFAEDLSCLLIHGSAIKGGMIEGFSDLDVQVFLKPNAFTEFGLKLQSAFKLQNLVGDFDASKFGADYLQILFLNIEDIPEWYTPPMKGTFKILFGKLPENLNYNMNDFRKKIRKFLVDLPSVIGRLVANFADSSNHQIYRRTRYVATIVFPAMYSLLTYNDKNPGNIWSKDKLLVLELFKERYAKQQISILLTQFFSLIKKIAKDHSNLALLKEAFSVGIQFLMEAAKIGSKELKG